MDREAYCHAHQVRPADVYPNAYCSSDAHADRCLHDLENSLANRHADCNTNRNADCHPDARANLYADCCIHSHGNRLANCLADCKTNGNPDCYSNSNADCYANLFPDRNPNGESNSYPSN